MLFSRILNFTETLVLRCWWVILFCLLCAIFYEQGRKKIDVEYQKLHTQLTKIEILKQEKLERKEDLMLKVNSQSDPDFVELLLMKELGVVPEGHLKIYFSD
jgi:hypothetical protein